MEFASSPLLERMAVAGKVDREAGVLHDVQLLGPKSKNGRRYSRRAMENAVSKYNGAKVYVDHPDDIGTDRKWKDWAGVVENARFSGGAIRADIRLRKKSVFFDELVEAAEEFSEFFGMSHVADGESRMEAGEEVIESIREVFSVDIVQVPATASGLRESVRLEQLGDSNARSMARMARKFMDWNDEAGRKLFPVDEAIEVAALYVSQSQRQDSRNSVDGPPAHPCGSDIVSEGSIRDSLDPRHIFGESTPAPPLRLCE